jgi:two-component system, LytTR family, response regulator
MLSVIVADDEKIARRRLARLIHETGVAEVVAACAGGTDAITQIIALKPQILFLDVQMPDIDGFQVLAEIEGKASPLIIFVTAFDKYAVRAFEFHAVDYLLKPYDTARFREAFARARQKLAQGNSKEDERIRALIAEYFSARYIDAKPPLDRLTVRIDGVLRVIRVADIDWFATEGNYIRIHLGSGSYLVRLTAASIETLLDPSAFVRIHRRYIVNVDRIVEVQPWFAGDAIVVLRNGAKLKMSRTYRERVHARLGSRENAPGSE